MFWTPVPCFFLEEFIREEDEEGLLQKQKNHSKEKHGVFARSKAIIFIIFIMSLSYNWLVVVFLKEKTDQNMLKTLSLKNKNGSKPVKTNTEHKNGATNDREAAEAHGRLKGWDLRGPKDAWNFDLPLAPKGTERRLVVGGVLVFCWGEEEVFLKQKNFLVGKKQFFFFLSGRVLVEVFVIWSFV